MKQSIDATTLDQLDDLATGQLGPITAWRLRRRIKRDPKLARDWNEVRGLREYLRSAVHSKANFQTVPRRGATITLGGLSMQKSAVVAAVGWLVFLSVTGAVAMRVETKTDTESDETKLFMGERWLALADYYNRPQRITPDYGEGSGLELRSLPGLVGDHMYEFPEGVPCCFDQHIVWKSYGDVHVVAKLHLRLQRLNVSPNDSKMFALFPERTLINEAESEQVAAKEDLNEMPGEYRREIAACHPVGHRVPETYWQLGDSNGDIDRKTWQWKHVVKSGKFEGYGHFVIRDDEGRSLLTLDVSRPRFHHRLTLARSGDRVKPQKVVPGWDGEE